MEIVKWNVQYSEFGLNLGGGIQYDLSEKLILNTEAKYSLVGKFMGTATINPITLSVGLAYKFN